MKEIDPIKRIHELCRERGWSLYQLAKSSDIAYSTLNTMLNKYNTPSIPTLQKLCNGFGISMTEFWNPGHALSDLTVEQQECLNTFNALTPEEKKLAVAFMKGMLHKL